MALGRIVVRADARGGETFYGVWRTDGRRVKRRLGAKRPRGGRTGLTTTHAERALRRLIDRWCRRQPWGSPTLAAAGERYRSHLAAQGRKRATVASVESTFRIWLEPQLGDRSLDAIRPEDVEDLMRVDDEAGVGAKSIRNYIGTCRRSTSSRCIRAVGGRR